MTDQKKDAPAVKESGEKNTDSEKNGDKSPEELKQIADDQKGRAVKAEADLKEANSTIEDLKAQLDAKKGDDGQMSDADVEAIAAKHGVDPAFAKDLLNLSQSKATEAVAKTEEKLTKELEDQKNERNQEKLDQAFDAAFNKSSEEYGDLEIDKEAVKDLYFTRKASNQELTVADVLQSLYGAASGKATTEDDARGDDRNVGETIDFAKASKDPELLKKVMADPKAKKDYYKWRDANDL